MKKQHTIVAILTALICIAARAQVYHGNSFDLNTTIPSNQAIEYKAESYIILNKGFYSKPQSPNYAMMEIDPYFNPGTPFGEIYWKPNDCNGIDKGRLGFYPMEFDVNDNGAATISMPLEFPEGINGLTPHLSLEYNSQGGEGIVGIGWSLGGMSKISRVPYTYMYDDSCHAVVFSNTDELSLDGIILRKGTKDNKTCYYPEIYDYSIVYPINANGNIDDGFRVLKRDGNVYTYSAKYYLQSQIGTPIEWHLSRVEDPFGNYIQYNYENDTLGSFYPVSIQYTGHQDIEPSYEIVFNYDFDTRKDCPPKWFSKPDANQQLTGFSRITKKLDNIQCMFNNNRIIQYGLNYTTLDWNIRALTSVSKSTFDYNGQKDSYNMLISTGFEWNPIHYQLQFETAKDSVCLNKSYGYEQQWHQYKVFAARFKNDNLAGQHKYEHDIVHLMRKNEGNHGYYLNVFHSDNAIGPTSQCYHYNENGFVYDCSIVNNSLNDGRTIVEFMPADTDGDGLNEIVCVSYSHGSSQFNITLVKLEDSNNPGDAIRFVITPTSAGPLSGSITDLTDFNIGDFNGDGLSDLFFMHLGNPMVKISTVEYPFSINVIPGNCSFVNTRKIVIGDFNGDKKDQIIVLYKDDDVPDARYFRISQTGNNQYMLSNGQSILNDIPNGYYDITDLSRRLCSGDFNGDAKTDLAVLHKTEWQFFFSKGNGVFGKAWTNEYPVNDSIVTTPETDTITPAYTIVTDLDKDGCDDIAVLKVKVIQDDSYNNNYKGIFREDYLIRPTDCSVTVRQIRNLKWDEAKQDSVDVCIDSIEMVGDYYATYSTAFVPVVGNHKGTAPNEIMICRMDCFHYTSCNLGAVLHNTGCLYDLHARAIKRIVTSLGATTEIEYRPVSYQFAQDNGLEGMRREHRDLTPVLPFNGYMNIVEKVRVEMNDFGATDTASPKTYRMTRYHYGHPLYHTRGRGFLGFETVWQRKQGQKNEDDIFRLQSYSLNNCYDILVPDSLLLYTFLQYNSNQKRFLCRTGFTYSFQTGQDFSERLGNIPNKVFSPYMSQQVTKRNDGSPISFEKNVVEKNEFGNVVKNNLYYGTQVYHYPYYEQNTIEYDDYLGENRWILGIPKDETLSQYLFENTAVVTRLVSYQNNMNTGRHSVKTTEPGNDKQLIENYTYDGFGNLLSTTAIGSGTTRVESVVYSSDGRFPIAKTNALGQTTTYGFDQATGKIDGITDPNGLTTHYHYDVLGNLIQTEYPSGILEDQSMRWVGNPIGGEYHPDTPDFGCPIYFTYSKRSGERESYVFYDQHNRKLREVSYNMAGEKIYVDYHYFDISGLLKSVSAPYYRGDTARSSHYTYDYLDRTTRIERPDGSYMTHDYQGSTQEIRDFDGQNKILSYSTSGLLTRSRHNNYLPLDDINFTYYGDGKLHESNIGYGNVVSKKITYTYDINRNPKTITDPSLGTLTYDYNAFGELIHSTTPNNETRYSYDALGRMVNRIDNDGSSSWYYDNGFIGMLSRTAYQPTDGPWVNEEYHYDNLGRLTRHSQAISGLPEWTFEYTYNRLGQQSSITYPSGKKIKYRYNNKGFMDCVIDAASGNVIWQANASDRWDNVCDFTEGDLQVAYDYDTVTGLVNGISATRNGQTILNQTYHWTSLGNLQWRTDETIDLKESFSYDGYNRLKTANGTNLSGDTPYFSQNFSFDLTGNITAKTGIASYSYDSPTNPYAVTSVQPVAGQEGLFTNQTATYTSFDKLMTLAQDGKTLSIEYGIDRQRVMQTFSNGNSTRTKRYFTPLYETVTENGVTKKLHYLTAETGLFAIFASYNNGGGTMHYTLKDHQGNLTATICGNTVERLSYDAWGRRRNPVGFGYDNVTHTFDRGYTLHEHYDDFDLINMNGRLYDPVLGRMLSPDIAIQDEHNAQAYNRYSYCLNNPLRFTDPSGYVVEIPPEYINLFEYAKDVERFRGFISELGIDPNSVQYNTTEAEGRQITTVSWMIGNDKYDMVKYDYIYLRDYYQQYKNGCAATCFWALESQWNPQTDLNEDYYMECDPKSYSKGLSVRKLSELFVGTPIGENYFPGISSTYHLYHEKEISDDDRQDLLKECFNTFRDGDAMMFLLPSTTMYHDVNATSAARLQINGKSTDYSIWIWDSSMTNGGYKPLNVNEVKYRFIIAK